jgi:hypothetical protein
MAAIEGREDSSSSSSSSNDDDHGRGSGGCGQALQFASPELRADRDVVIAAQRQDRNAAMEFADKSLCFDRDLGLFPTWFEGRAGWGGDGSTPPHKREIRSKYGGGGGGGGGEDDGTTQQPRRLKSNARTVAAATAASTAGAAKKMRGAMRVVDEGDGGSDDDDDDDDDDDNDDVSSSSTKNDASTLESSFDNTSIDMRSIDTLTTAGM